MSGQSFGLCRVYVEGGTPDLSHFIPSERLPTERLVPQLQPLDASLRGLGGQLRWVVDQLGNRKVSWAVIGEALGMSRQSAWERFS
ncbi:MAG TPA: hypothetical protein VFW47_05490 [Phenylobacterium sp.]|nr:hypothetical protein [Phenylobacterium sp.]